MMGGLEEHEVSEVSTYTTPTSCKAPESLNKVAILGRVGLSGLFTGFFLLSQDVYGVTSVTYPIIV